MEMRCAQSAAAYGVRLGRLLRPSFLVVLLVPSVLLLVLHASPASSATFRCAAGGTQQQAVSCESLLGFPTPPNATYTFLKTLFGIKSIHRLFAANNLPPTTDPNTPIPPLTTLRIPLPCICTSSGPSPTRPVYYKARTDSSLDFVARSVFEGFVDARELAAANGIGDPTSKVGAGTKLRVPLPCSCDRVDGSDVVHYAHKAVAGDTLEGVAAEFGTKVETIKAVNGIESVQAEQVLDVPLRVCSSSVRTDSLDSPLLVPNNSYVLTAGNCVQCGCSSSTWQLQCSVIQFQVQGLKTKWPVCPPATCPSANLTLGNTTSPISTSSSSSSSSSSCDATMCAYAGYNKAGILTTLTPTSVCPGTTGGSSSSVTSGGSSARSRVVVVEMGMGMGILLLLSTLFYFRVV